MSIPRLSKHLNLSLSTVYRAVSRPNSVSSEVLQSVHKAARELNIDLQKRSPRGRPPKFSEVTGKTKLAVWFVGNSAEQVHSVIGDQIALIRSRCLTVGYSCHFLFTATTDEIPIEIQKGEIDAVLLEGLLPSDRVMKQLGRLPVVWIMTRLIEDYKGDYVEPDNEVNGRIAADYLVGRGHKEIAYIATDADHRAFLLREASFLKRCSYHNVNVTRFVRNRENQVQHPRNSSNSIIGEELAAELLRSTPRPTGIYMAGMNATGPIYNGLRKLGANTADFDCIIGDYWPHFPGSVWDTLDPKPAGIDINLRSIMWTAVEIAALRLRQKDLEGRIGVQISPTLAIA